MEDMPGPRLAPLGLGFVIARASQARAAMMLTGSWEGLIAQDLASHSHSLGDLCLEPDLVGTQFAYL